MDKWINKIQHIQTVAYYYSALKRKEILKHASTQMKLDIIQSEISRSQKDKYHMTSFI